MNRQLPLMLVVLILVITLTLVGCGGQDNNQKAVDEMKLTSEESVNNEESVLTIEGSGVADTTQLTLQELQEMPLEIVQDDYFSLNNWGTTEYFSFKGVSLWELLNKAGIKDSAEQVVITSEDGYSITYTIAEVKRDDYIDEQNSEKKYKMIIAWEENGEAYKPTKYPFRLVMGQKEPGDINKQNWIQKVKTITVE